MSDSYEDKVDHQMFEIRFKATNQEGNKVWMELMGTPEWAEYDTIDSLHRYGDWDMARSAVADELCRLSKRRSALYQWLSKKAFLIATAQGLL